MTRSLRRTSMLLPCALLVLALAALALRAPSASASFNQFAIMQDDDLLINTTPARADQALMAMKQLGVNYVRVTVLWTVVAQNAKTGANAHRFHADNPATYPRRNWDRYDNLVLNAQRLGIGVYFTVTGPPPRWAQATAPARYRRDQAAWMPNSGDFYKFVKALGTRYSGRYRKEGRNGPLLPAVHLWGIWNEPNQGGWLLPQSLYSPIAHQVIPMSPVLYRALYYAGHKALSDTGHGKDAIPDRRDGAARKAAGDGPLPDRAEDFHPRADVRRSTGQRVYGRRRTGARLRELHPQRATAGYWLGAPSVHEGARPDGPADRSQLDRHGQHQRPAGAARPARDHDRSHRVEPSDHQLGVRLRDEPARPLQRHGTG